MATDVKNTPLSLELQQAEIIPVLVYLYQHRLLLFQNPILIEKIKDLGFEDDFLQLPVFVRTLLNKTDSTEEKIIFLYFLGYLTTSSVTEFNTYFQFLKNKKIEQIIDLSQLEFNIPKKSFLGGIFGKDKPMLVELDPNFYFKKMDDYLEENKILLNSVDRIGLDLRAQAVKQSFEKAQIEDQLLDQMIDTFEHFKSQFSLFFKRLLSYKNKMKYFFDRLKTLIEEVENRNKKSILNELSQKQQEIKTSQATVDIPSIKKEKINSF